MLHLMRAAILVSFDAAKSGELGTTSEWIKRESKYQRTGETLVRGVVGKLAALRPVPVPALADLLVLGVV